MGAVYESVNCQNVYSKQWLKNVVAIMYNNGELD